MYNIPLANRNKLIIYICQMYNLVTHLFLTLARVWCKVIPRRAGSSWREGEWVAKNSLPHFLSPSFPPLPSMAHGLLQGLLYEKQALWSNDFNLGQNQTVLVAVGGSLK
jgi:hypothetical protein